MVRYHHQLNGHKYEQTPGNGEGQGSMVSMMLQRVEQDLATEQQMGLYYLMCNCWVYLMHNPLSNSWDNQYLPSHYRDTETEAKVACPGHAAG